MKRCPECRRDYYDDTLLYCLDDGNALLEGPATAPGGDEPATAILHSTAAPGEAATKAQIHTTEQTAVLPSGVAEIPQTKGFDKRLVLAPFALAVIVLGGFFGYRYVTPAKQISSIAVMPFVNEGGNADFDYLSDGMTETLISSLSQLPNLNVRPRSSVFQYKGKGTNSQTIAKELNVQAILNGRVVQRGQDISLFVELIDIGLDKVVWSQQYNRKQSDLVVLQGDIARDVLNKLKSKLSGADVAKVEKNSAVDPEAYQLYLKGLFQRNRRTAESLKLAVEFFKQAIEKDPNYAPAYSGLATTYRSFPGWSLAMPKDIMPQVKTAALRALELDDSLAEAHIALGGYLAEFEWERVEAEKEFRRAVELEPNNPAAHANLGMLLRCLRRFDEAIAEARRAVELDPLSKRGVLASALMSARRFDDAIAEQNAVLILDPNYAETHYLLGLAYFRKGSYREAITSYQKYLELDVDDPLGKGSLAEAYAKAGDRKEAFKILDHLKQESTRRYIPGAAFASAYLALGNKEEALKWLDKDFDDRFFAVNEYSIDPSLDELRDEPRFKAMLKRLNLPE